MRCPTTKPSASQLPVSRLRVSPLATSLKVNSGRLPAMSSDMLTLRSRLSSGTSPGKISLATTPTALPAAKLALAKSVLLPAETGSMVSVLPSAERLWI